MGKPNISQPLSRFWERRGGRAAALALATLLPVFSSSARSAESASEEAVGLAVLTDELADFARIHRDAAVLAAAGRLSRSFGRLTDAGDPYSPDRIFADARDIAGSDRTLTAFVLRAEADRTRHVTSVLVSTHMVARLGSKPLDIQLDCRPGETMIANVRQVKDSREISPVLPAGPYPLEMSVKGPGAAARIARNIEAIEAVWTPPAGNGAHYVVEIRNLSKSDIVVDFNAD